MGTTQVMNFAVAVLALVSLAACAFALRDVVTAPVFVFGADAQKATAGLVDASLVDGALLAERLSGAAIVFVVPGLRSDVVAADRELWAPLRHGVVVPYVENVEALFARSFGSRKLLSCESAAPSLEASVDAGDSIVFEFEASCSAGTVASAIAAAIATASPSARVLVTATPGSLQSPFSLRTADAPMPTLSVATRGDKIVNGTKYIKVYWTPPIWGGMLAMFWILLMVMIALCCTMSIQTQAVYEEPSAAEKLGAAGSD